MGSAVLSQRTPYKPHTLSEFAMSSVKLAILFLVFTSLKVKGQLLTKDYYIKIDKANADSTSKLIKTYGKGGAFVLSYKCKCYADDKDLEFYFDSILKYGKVLIKGAIPVTVSMLDFSKIANDAYSNMRSFGNGHIYLIEEVDSYHYIKYKVVFFEAAHPE